ncbi:MAG: hypothetical protein ACUVT2_08155 [Thiobacillaceae bacterium]
MSLRETAGQFGLGEIIRPEVTLYNSREEYREKAGKEPPPYNPDLPNKYWAWTAPTSARTVALLVPVIREGVPVLESMLVPLGYAQSVNIPGSAANAEKRYADETLPFPVEPLRPDEYLALTFGGLIVVRNRRRFAEPVLGFEEKALSLLERIATKLGV